MTAIFLDFIFAIITPIVVILTFQPVPISKENALKRARMQHRR